MEIVSLVITLVAYGIGLAVLYFIIRSAVRAGLADHYKAVRRFEVTGVWNQGPDDSKLSWTAAERAAAGAPAE